jgi:phage recombination protein Bet
VTTLAIRTEQDVAAQSAALAIRPGQEFWTEKQRAALSVLGIKGASNGDLAVYMHYCQKTGLDPFSRQIYGIMRREKQGDQWVDKFTIQVGIDGFRVIRDRVAERTGWVTEFEDTVWYDGAGVPYSVWLAADPPAACRVVLLKIHVASGRVLRFPAVLRTSSYMAVIDGRPMGQWRTQPEHMIEKCCEAFATRRAYPNDLSGIYIEEELPAQAPIQAHSERVTAADILGQPETPAAQESQSLPQPAPPVTTPPHRNQSGKPALDKLTALFGQLQLDETEQDTIIAWLAGDAEWTASTSQVRNVSTVLTDYLKAADGDVAAAREAMWAQYRKVSGDG